MMIPSDQMPWQWFAKVYKGHGPRKTYRVFVNGKLFIQGKAGSPVRMLKRLRLPDGALVRVEQII